MHFDASLWFKARWGTQLSSCLVQQCHVPSIWCFPLHIFCFQHWESVGVESAIARTPHKGSHHYIITCHSESWNWASTLYTKGHSNFFLSFSEIKLLSSLQFFSQFLFLANGQSAEEIQSTVIEHYLFSFRPPPPPPQRQRATISFSSFFVLLL